MAVRKLLIAPDKRLKQRSTPVETVNDEIRALTDDMLETMYAAEGMGLAAIQIGVPKRVIVADVHGRDEPPAPVRLINPELVWQGDEPIVHEEGCLSLPDQFAEVTRPGEIRVRYRDMEGEIREMTTDGVLAVCIQHEIDHLEGVLFVDHVSPLKRSMSMRKLAKARRTEGEALGQPQAVRA